MEFSGDTTLKDAIVLASRLAFLSWLLGYIILMVRSFVAVRNEYLRELQAGPLLTIKPESFWLNMQWALAGAAIEAGFVFLHQGQWTVWEAGMYMGSCHYDLRDGASACALAKQMFDASWTMPIWYFGIIFGLSGIASFVTRDMLGRYWLVISAGFYLVLFAFALGLVFIIKP